MYNNVFCFLSFSVFLFLLFCQFLFLVASFDGLRPLLVTSHCSIRSLSNIFVRLFVRTAVNDVLYVEVILARM